MAPTFITRIKRDLEEVLSCTEVTQKVISIEPIDDSLCTFKAKISGPPGTPYEGGTFELSVILPESYPFKAPEVRCLTKIWHPNISSNTGVICLDPLKDKWVVTTSLRLLLLCIQQLLSDAVPDDALDTVAGKQMLEYPHIFHDTAKHWTAAYAGGPASFEEMDRKIQKLVIIGAKEHDARVALSTANWNLQEAADNIPFK